MYQIYTRDLKTSWKLLLRKLLTQGQNVKVDDTNRSSRSGGNTLELQNMNLEIWYPETDWIGEQTPVAKKFWKQMMLKEVPKLAESHYKWLIDYGQLRALFGRLREKPQSRRCYFTFWAQDQINKPYALCCTGGQFLVRAGSLNLTTFWRSNDALNGYPHNALGFIILQHKVAGQLNFEVGHYIHHAVSMHLYEQDMDLAWRVLRDLEEGEEMNENRIPPLQ